MTTKEDILKEFKRQFQANATPRENVLLDATQALDFLSKALARYALSVVKMSVPEKWLPVDDLYARTANSIISQTLENALRIVGGGEDGKG